MYKVIPAVECRTLLSMRGTVQLVAFVLTVSLSAVSVMAAEVSWTEYPASQKKGADKAVEVSLVTVVERTTSTGNEEPANKQTVDLILALLRDHPALLALESRKLALIERSQTTLALPDPMVSLGINNISISSPSFDEFLPTNKLLGVRQEFPSRKGRIAQADQALAQADAIDLMITAKRASLLADVFEHLIQKRSIDQKITLARDRLRKYDELTEVVESEIDAGNPSVFRLAEIDAERARVSGLINTLNAQSIKHEAELIALTGEVPIINVPAPTMIEWSGDYTQFHAVRIADAELNSINESLAIADASRFKRWGVQLAYQQRESSDNFKGDDWLSGQVFFTAPLWYRQSQAPEQRAAEASVEAGRQALLLAQRTVLAEHTALLARLRAATENIRLMQQEVNAIQDKIDTQMISYEAGIGYFAPIVDGDIALLKLRAEIITETATVDTYTARINALLTDKETENDE